MLLLLLLLSTGCFWARWAAWCYGQAPPARWWQQRQLAWPWLCFLTTSRFDQHTPLLPFQWVILNNIAINVDNINNSLALPYLLSFLQWILSHVIQIKIWGDSCRERQLLSTLSMVNEQYWNLNLWYWTNRIACFSGSVFLHVNLQMGGRLAEKVAFLTSKGFLAGVRKHVIL